MWLEAIIPQEDLVELLDELAPLSFALGDEGRMWLSEPTDVRLVEGAGLRVTCSARINLPLLGGHVPVKVHTATVLLRPEVAVGPQEPSLVFVLEIEHVDFAILPDVVDDAVRDRINRELAKRRTELAWSYAKTLSHVFELPGKLDPVQALVITAKRARVETTATALALAIEMEVGARREGAALARTTSATPAPSAASSSPRSSSLARIEPSRAAARDRATRLKRGAVFAGLVAAAVASGFTIGRRTA
jgi:hypothetical protein